MILEDLLRGAVDWADDNGARLTIRKSNSHGLRFSIGLIDKNNNKVISEDEFWGDTIDEALKEFLRNYI